MSKSLFDANNCSGCCTGKSLLNIPSGQAVSSSNQTVVEFITTQTGGGGGGAIGQTVTDLTVTNSLTVGGISTLGFLQIQNSTILSTVGSNIILQPGSSAEVTVAGSLLTNGDYTNLCTTRLRVLDDVPTIGSCVDYDPTGTIVINNNSRGINFIWGSDSSGTPTLNNGFFGYDLTTDRFQFWKINAEILTSLGPEAYSRYPATMIRPFNENSPNIGCMDVVRTFLIQNPDTGTTTQAGLDNPTTIYGNSFSPDYPSTGYNQNDINVLSLTGNFNTQSVAQTHNVTGNNLTYTVARNEIHSFGNITSSSEFVIYDFNNQKLNLIELSNFQNGSFSNQIGLSLWDKNLVDIRNTSGTGVINITSNGLMTIASNNNSILIRTTAGGSDVTVNANDVIFLTAGTSVEISPNATGSGGGTLNVGNGLNVTGTAFISGLLTANAGATVNNALLTANDGATVNNVVLTANAGMTVAGGNLTVSAGSATITGGLLTANNGATINGAVLTANDGATINNAALTANDSATVRLGLTVATGSFTVSAGSATITGGLLTANNGATVNGTLTATSTSNNNAADRLIFGNPVKNYIDNTSIAIAAGDTGRVLFLNGGAVNGSTNFSSAYSGSGNEYLQYDGTTMQWVTYPTTLTLQAAYLNSLLVGSPATINLTTGNGNGILIQDGAVSSLDLFQIYSHGGINLLDVHYDGSTNLTLTTGSAGAASINSNLLIYGESTANTDSFQISTYNSILTTQINTLTVTSNTNASGSILTITNWANNTLITVKDPINTLNSNDQALNVYNGISVRNYNSFNNAVIEFEQQSATGFGTQMPASSGNLTTPHGHGLLWVREDSQSIAPQDYTELWFTNDFNASAVPYQGSAPVILGPSAYTGNFPHALPSNTILDCIPTFANGNSIQSTFISVDGNNNIVLNNATPNVATGTIGTIAMGQLTYTLTTTPVTIGSGSLSGNYEVIYFTGVLGVNTTINAPGSVVLGKRYILIFDPTYGAFTITLAGMATPNTVYSTYGTTIIVGANTATPGWFQLY